MRLEKAAVGGKGMGTQMRIATSPSDVQCRAGKSTYLRDDTISGGLPLHWTLLAHRGHAGIAQPRSAGALDATSTSLRIAEGYFFFALSNEFFPSKLSP